MSTSTRARRADTLRDIDVRLATPRVAWRPIFEPIWGETYIVSPRNGALYVFPRTFFEDAVSAAYLSAIGCFANERVEVLNHSVIAEDQIPAHRKETSVTRLFGAVEFQWLALSTRIVGLRRTLARLLCNDRPSPARRSVDEILREIKTKEGAAHGTQCLPRALARWSALSHAGYSPTFIVGVSMPSGRMHSWITLNGRHVGEDPDEVAGYQPAVAFSAGSLV